MGEKVQECGELEVGELEMLLKGEQFSSSSGGHRCLELVTRW